MEINASETAQKSPKNFERRKLLQSGAMGALALLSLKANAMTKEGGATLSMKVAISRNHGHDFTTLSLEELIKLARKIDAEGSSSLSIQGRSRHPHNIEMDSKSILDILLGKEVKIESTRDAGHTHLVTLSLV